MAYQRLVAAIDPLVPSSSVTSVAGALAGLAHASLTVVHVSAPGTLRTRPAGEAPLADVVELQGIPGIEIPRFADHQSADLLVVGRTPRTSTARLLVGDTADAIVRRSRVEVLLVPPTGLGTGPIVAALDGSARSMRVLTAACMLAVVLDRPLNAVTVEHPPADEMVNGALAMPLGRTSKLRSLVRELEQSAGRPITMAITRGDAVAAILETARALSASVLVIGFRRGGPPVVLEGGSVARRLVHAAPISVLTVPL